MLLDSLKRAVKFFGLKPLSGEGRGGSVPAPIIGLALACSCLVLDPILRVSVGDASDREGIDDGRYQRLEMLLQKTIFRVDAVRAVVELDSATARRLQTTVADRECDDQLIDSLADVVMQTQHVDISLRFLVSVNRKRFLKGARKNLERMVDARLIDEAQAEELRESNRKRFAYLEDEPLKDGDHLVYSVRGDSVRTRHLDTDGEVRFEDVTVGAERRLVALSSLFLKGSDFRRGLLESLCH